MAMFALLTGPRSADKAVRRAIKGWVFDLNQRETDKAGRNRACPGLLSADTAQASNLDELAAVRRVLDTLALKMGGKPVVANTVIRRRAMLYNIVEYSRELGALTSNRIVEVKRVTPRVVHAIDKRIVINP